MSKYDLKSIWAVLSETTVRAGQSLVVATATHLEDGREVLVGIDAGSNRHVLFPLLAAEQFGDAGQRLNLQLRLVELPEGRYASAVCTDRRLDEVFAQFAGELIDSVLHSGKPGRDMRNAFGRWLALFSESPGERLSKSEEIGLLAELLTLSRVLSVGGSVASWAGPDKALHDFRLEGSHLEVKATLAREGLRVSVHGVGQLDAEEGDNLHLLVYRFEESAAGASLVEVIREIESEVDNVVLFEQLLRRSGFDWQRSSAYETKYGFESLCFDVLQVQFPRIVPSSFTDGAPPLGTSQLTYVIDVSTPFLSRDSELELERVIRMIAGTR
jgi:hypothetical protein